MQRTKRKLGVSTLLIAAILMVSIIPAAAVHANPGDITVLINGQSVEFDQPPIIQDGRTLVPLRAIFEAMGAEIEWDGSTQTVTAVRGNTNVVMRIGAPTFTRNGIEIALDVPAQITNGRTLVPARAVAESFEADVDWHGDTRTIIIFDAYLLGQAIEQPITATSTPPVTTTTPPADGTSVPSEENPIEIRTANEEYDPDGLFERFSELEIIAITGMGPRFTITHEGQTALIEDRSRSLPFTLIIMEGVAMTIELPNNPAATAVFTVQGNNILVEYAGRNYTIQPNSTLDINW
jgi:hypothetical protein